MAGSVGVLFEAGVARFRRGRGHVADLAEVLERLEGDTFDDFVARGHAVLRNLECAELPVVVAVHGLALAGGLELVLAGDVVFAAASAKFGDQHARYGLVPGWGGTQRLPRIVGARRALDLMFSARWIEASEARDWGLVNYVVDDAAKFREGSGKLLAEIMRIKAEGDFKAGKALVEKYGVKIDPDLHKEVIDRIEKLNLPSVTGFVQPELHLVSAGGKPVDVEVHHPMDLADQMLRWSGRK